MATTAPSDDVVGAISKKGKSSTLTREADPPPPLPTVAVNKPQVPAKPAHIRPGLKPVKIPTVDDKVWVSTIHNYLINFLIDSSNHFFYESNANSPVQIWPSFWPSYCARFLRMKVFSLR